MTIKINGDNTVANPGFSGNDTDTGLQVGTNELKLVTGGTEAITVNSSQNVGIGTASPSAKLDVSGTLDATKFRGDSGTAADPSICPGVDNDTGMYRPGSNTIGFSTAGNERMRILSGGGLTFNGDTAQANALDDYEEGTWTPTFYGETTAGSYTFSPTSWYIKVGNMVTVNTQIIDITEVSAGSGLMRIGGLPFTGVSASQVGSVLLDKFNLESTTVSLASTLVSGVKISVRETRDNTTDRTLTVANITSNGADIFLCLTYKAA